MRLSFATVFGSGLRFKPFWLLMIASVYPQAYSSRSRRGTFGCHQRQSVGERPKTLPEEVLMRVESWRHQLGSSPLLRWP